MDGNTGYENPEAGTSMTAATSIGNSPSVSNPVSSSPDDISSLGNNSSQIGSSQIIATPAGSHQADSGSESYFWIMIGLLMLFVLMFLIVLKQVRKARLAAYPEMLSGFSNRYKQNQRQLID